MIDRDKITREGNLYFSNVMQSYCAGIHAGSVDVRNSCYDREDCNYVQ